MSSVSGSTRKSCASRAASPTTPAAASSARRTPDELSAALFTFLEELEVVVTTGFLEIESIGGLYPLATLTCAEQAATDTDPQGGEPFTYTFTAETNKVEVPVGVCDLAWTNPSGNETTIQVNIEADRTTFVRGSLLKFPQGAGEIYVLKAQDGTVIWQDQIEQGDWVWVLPGIYTLRSARAGRRPDPDLVHRPDAAGLGDPARDLHGPVAAGHASWDGADRAAHREPRCH